MPKTPSTKDQDLDEVVGKAAKGLSMLLIVKLLNKVLQLFFNFEVIRNVEPKVYGLTVYFNFLVMNQTFLTHSSFRQVYQKRVKSVDQETINTSARNLVSLFSGAKYRPKNWNKIFERVSIKICKKFKIKTIPLQFDSFFHHIL